jgi:signal transduction histidine kinase
VTLNKSDEQHDDRIAHYIEAARDLRQGKYNVELQLEPSNDEIGRLGLALHDLAIALEQRYRELQKIDEITTQINAGLLLDEILENIYRDFREIIPYNRIGFSLIQQDNNTICSRWSKTDQPEVFLKAGYQARLAGSSLEKIIETGRPRIINDLEEYYARKPTSESTMLILKEGIRSSLTCPLIANGIPVGFIFFSSIKPNTYAAIHIRNFLRIAQQLSVIVEKGRLVTELAEQKANIEKQNTQLTHLNKQMNQFLGMAAHDLRNPIAYIQMSSEFLLSPIAKISEKDKEKMLGDIHHQARHMLEMLNELLDVTKIEAGQLVLKPEPINLTAFLHESVERHSKMAAPKGTQVIVEGQIPDGVVSADPGRLRQAIDNLVSNAVKYAPTNSTVRVGASKLSDCWRINIRDEGPGIKPEDREKLFKDFARLSARPTGGESSTGLGLAITRRIVEAHGGTIDVDSEVGQGATFWFTLPG